MAMIRPETEMKDSGVQWIGDIPSDWNIKPLYACLDEINQKNNPVVTTNILSLTNTDGVIPYSERGNQGNKSKENFEEYKVVYPNTIVANSMNILIGSVGLSKYEGCVSPVYYVYMAKPQVDIRYMNYLFQMEPFQKRLRQFANGILEIRLRVSSHDILHQKVAVPDYDEQQVIADYLDETCSQIDEIIAEAKASIDEYKELKQSVIFEAVTKGLDKNVKMKDSGVEWIGEIPESWNIRMLNQYVSQVKCKNSDLSETNLLSLSYGKIKRKNINSNDGLLPESFDNYNVVDENDIVLRLTDLQNDHKSLRVGLVTERGIITSAYVTIRPNGINAAYLALLLHAFDYKKGFYGMGSGIRQGLTFDGIKSLKIVVPSNFEQDDIVKHIMKMTEKCDSLISEKESLINDLEAYKKSLIYEVVTGKRRVV